MITIINKRNGKKVNFKNYKKLYDYIAHRQRCKMRNKPIDDWFVARHSYRRAKAFHDFVGMQEVAKKFPKWKNKSFDVLEISEECSREPIIMAITSETNIDPYLEAWCRRYCQSNGFKLVEVLEEDGILHVKKTRHLDISDDEQSLGNKHT